MEEKYVKWVLLGAGVVSVVLAVGYIVFLCLVITHSGEYNEFTKQIIATANGALVGSISTGVVGFWLGSSIGSLLKNLKAPEETPKGE